jgi:hypothetical protein
MNDPGQDLLTHTAPPNLVARALDRMQQRRQQRRQVFLAAAALLIGLTGGWIAHGAWAEAPADQLAPPPSVLVAATEDPVSVRLVLHAPDAESVSIAGSFNGWHAKATPMTRTADGTWHATVSLARGRYEYLFVIDETQWAGDPTAPLTTPDDFGQANAILDV